MDNNKQQVLYRTKFNKPIYRGQSYFAVLNNMEVIKTIAGNDDDPNVHQRFLNMTGAKNYVQSLTAKIQNKVIKPITDKIEEVKVEIEEKLEEAIEEEKIAKLTPFEQLDYIKSKEDWDKFVKRNNIKVSPNSKSLHVYFDKTELLAYMWNTGGTPYCCGGIELGSHDGYINSNHTRYTTETRLKILSQYIAVEFDKAVRLGVNNFGIVSYVIGNHTHPSCRIGYLLEASELFQHVSTFKNPNTNNTVKMYTITNEWRKN